MILGLFNAKGDNRTTNGTQRDSLWKRFIKGTQVENHDLRREIIIESTALNAAKLNYNQTIQSVKADLNRDTNKMEKAMNGYLEVLKELKAHHTKYLDKEKAKELDELVQKVHEMWKLPDKGRKLV